MLSPRQGTVLKIIVNEYIASGLPVASQWVARRYRLGVSPATIRNDMAYLEQEGYIVRPHTSAGGVPSHKGYRYFVESIEGPGELSAEEQRLVAHLFHQVELEMEEWVGLAASLLARLTQCAALVTRPQPVQSHFRHLDLVSLHQFLALLILVLREARLRQQLLPLSQPASQPELEGVAAKLNQAYAGMSLSQIAHSSLPLSPLEAEISQAVVEMMRRVDGVEAAEPYFSGWGHILNQPELRGNAAVPEVVAILEGRRLLRSLLPSAQGIRVIIGEENPEAALHPLSLVIGRYGIPEAVSGIIGVVGPTRMRYDRAISVVNHVSERLSHLLSEMYC